MKINKRDPKKSVTGLLGINAAGEKADVVVVFSKISQQRKNELNRLPGLVGTYVYSSILHSIHSIYTIHGLFNAFLIYIYRYTNRMDTEVTFVT